jgi:hypothetical protein
MNPKSRKCSCLLVFIMIAALAVAQNATPERKRFKEASRTGEQIL